MLYLSSQDVWLSVGGLVFVVIFSLKLVTLADVYVLRYINLVSLLAVQLEHSGPTINMSVHSLPSI